jgi:hypothetical protein
MRKRKEENHHLNSNTDIGVNHQLNNLLASNSLIDNSTTNSKTNSNTETQLLSFEAFESDFINKPEKNNNNVSKDIFDEFFSDFYPKPANDSAKADANLDLPSPNVISHQQFPQRNIPSAKTFLIDADPFSSSSSLSSQSTHLTTTKTQNPFDDNFELAETSNTTSNNNNNYTFIDPFDLGAFGSANTNSNTVDDPFLVFKSLDQDLLNKKEEFKMDDNQLDFSKVDELNDRVDMDIPVGQNEPETINEASQENEIEPAKPTSANIDNDDEDDDDYSIPPPPSKSQRGSVAVENTKKHVTIKDPFEEKIEDEDVNDYNKIEEQNENIAEEKEADEEDDMDGAFVNFSKEKPAEVEDLPSFANELKETNESLSQVNEPTDYNESFSLAMRKGDTNLDTINVSAQSKSSFKFQYDDDDDENENSDGEFKSKSENDNSDNAKTNKINEKSTLNVDEAAAAASGTPFSNRVKHIHHLFLIFQQQQQKLLFFSHLIMPLYNFIYFDCTKIFKTHT